LHEDLAALAAYGLRLNQKVLVAHDQAVAMLIAAAQGQTLADTAAGFLASLASAPLVYRMGSTT
jgi:hypothetical protein